MHTLAFRQEGERWPHSSQGDTLGESQAALLQSSHFSCGEPSFFNCAHTPATLDVTPSASPPRSTTRRPTAGLPPALRPKAEGRLSPGAQGAESTPRGLGLPGLPHPDVGKAAEPADGQQDALDLSASCRPHGETQNLLRREAKTTPVF